jgi:hypothetical protein
MADQTPAQYDNDDVNRQAAIYGAVGTQGPAGSTAPSGAVLTTSSSGSNVWYAIDDVVKAPIEPSVERLFEVMKCLDTELDDLRAKQWGQYNPRRALLWWKRIGFTRKLDAVFAMPFLAGLLCLMGATTFAAWNNEWWLGVIVGYLWLGISYIVSRIVTSTEEFL